MRGLVLIGVILVGLGIVGLVVQNVAFTETEEIVDIGPLEIHTEEEHNIPIPTIAGIIAVIAGLGLIVAGRNKT